MSYTPGLVSVIMPAHNAARFLRDAAESVLAQSYGALELLIVNDNSRDNTGVIADGISKTDVRARVIHKGMRQGVAGARNCGIEASAGEFVAFLDSDDIWYTDKLRIQVAAMRSHKAAFSYTSYDLIDPAGQKITTIRARPQVSYSAMLNGNQVGCLTAMYSVAMLGKVFMPTGIRQEDYLTWMNILKREAPNVGITEVTAAYRKGHATLSSRKYIVASWQWQAYRKGLGLGVGKSAFHMVRYAAYACVKHARA